MAHQLEIVLRSLTSGLTTALWLVSLFLCVPIAHSSPTSILSSEYFLAIRINILGEKKTFGGGPFLHNNYNRSLPLMYGDGVRGNISQTTLAEVTSLHSVAGT